MKRSNIYFVWLINTIVCISTFANAQQSYCKWIFGYQCGMDFTNGQSSPFFVDMQRTIYGGSAVFFDSAHNILLYSDGAYLYANNICIDTFITSNSLVHNICNNLPNTQSDLCTQIAAYQSLIILPVPGSNTDVFVCYFKQSIYLLSGGIKSPYYYARYHFNGISYERVFKNKRMLKEAVIPCNTIIRHANNRDWWILCRSPNDEVAQINSILITPCGIDTSRIYTLPVVQPFNGDWAFISASPSGNKITFSLYNEYFGVADFDRCTGNISNFNQYRFSYYDDYIFYDNGPQVHQMYFRNPVFADENLIYFSLFQLIRAIQVQTSQGQDTVMTVGAYVFDTSNPQLGFRQVYHYPNIPNTVQINYFISDMKRNCNGNPVININNGLLNDPFNNTFYNIPTYLLEIKNCHSFFDSYVDTLITFEMPEQRTMWGLPNIPTDNLQLIDCADPCTTGIDEIVSTNQEFKIYPNPTTNNVTIYSNEPLLHIEISDVLGRVVRQVNNLYQTQYTLDLSALPAGIYFVKAGSHKVMKLVKE